MDQITCGLHAQILMSALCSVLVNKSALTQLDPTSAHAETGTHSQMITQLAKVINYTSPFILLIQIIL